jgi:hypothetical protein
MDGERLLGVRTEIAGRAENVCTHEEAAVGQPERGLVPAGEANDAAALDSGGERTADRNALAGGDRVGVAAVASHEEGDADDGCGGQGVVELRGVERIGEKPALVDTDRRGCALQELAGMGEPGEASLLVEAVCLQGAGS